MALTSVVKGARHSVMPVTWVKGDGTPHDLTSATLTGVKEDKAGTATALDGLLSVTDGAAGTFSWTLGAVDVGTPGVFQVQFIATYPDTTFDVTEPAVWVVHDLPSP